MRTRFLDTNVLVYAVTQGDPREPTAMSLLAEGGVISVQVLNEFAHVLRRKLRFSWRDARQALEAVRAVCPDPRPLTFATHVAALDLGERYGVPIYDSLILAAALEAGCDTLLTEDLQHGQVIEGRLTIRNPFAGLA
ncbi:MAG: PIN domain-containing protein [Acetobacteraceae bacterium]|nr:PIN domain-containing protein [Acetobacteraceae bacterium]